MINFKYHDVIYNGMKFKLASVTSLIAAYVDQDLMGDSSFIPKSPTSENIGKKGHAAIDYLIKGNKIDDIMWENMPLYAQNVVKAYLDWKRKVGFRPRQSEFVVYSLTHAYAGQVDAIGTIKRHVALRDWVSAKPYLERKAMQVSAYTKAYLEMYPGRSITNSGIVELNKFTGQWIEYILTDNQVDEYFEQFLQNKKTLGII